jgi:hypothetical protein
VRADCTGAGEAGWHIDRSAEGKGNERADAWHRHEAAANLVVSGKANQQVVELSKAFPQCSANDEQRLYNEHQLAVARRLWRSSQVTGWVVLASAGAASASKARR